MLNITKLLGSFAIICLTLTLFALLGYGLAIIVQKISKNGSVKNINLFWSILAGFALFIWCYAVTVTRFQSILLLSPVPLFFLIKELLTENEGRPFSLRQILPYCIAALVLNFLFFVFRFNGIDNAVIKFVDSDFAYYFRASNYLNMHGIESNLVNGSAGNPANFYHYSDLWMYAAVSRLIYANPTFVFITALTIFSVMFSLSLTVYFTKRFKHAGKFPIVFFALLIAQGVPGFSSFFQNFILPKYDILAVPIFSFSKLIMPSILVVALLSLTGAKRLNALAAMLALASLLFVNITPAIVLGYALFLLILLFKKEIKFWGAIKMLASPAVFIGVALILQYKIFPLFNGPSAIAPVHNSVSILPTDLSKYAQGVMATLRPLFLQFLVLIPFIMILTFSCLFKEVRSTLQKVPQVIALLISIIIAGLVARVLLFNTGVDSYQIFGNIVPATFVLIIFEIFFFIYSRPRLSVLTFAYAAIILFVFYSNNGYKDLYFVNNMPRAEWLSLQSFVKRNGNTFKYMDMKSLKNYLSPYSKNTEVFPPITCLLYINANYINYNINTPAIPIDSEFITEQTKLLTNSIYYKFYTPNIKLSESPDSVIIKFARTNGINYFSVKMDTLLPSGVRKYTIDSLWLRSLGYKIYAIR